MNNQELYSRLKTCKIKGRKGYKEYSSDLNYFKDHYASLLPLEEVDQDFEEMILRHYDVDVAHGRFIVSNLKKTSDVFKEAMSEHIAYFFINDITEEQKIDYILKVYCHDFSSGLDHAETLYQISMDFSPLGQIQLMKSSEYLLKIIKNPNQASIDHALATSMTAVYECLRYHNYPINQDLMNQIRLSIPKWYNEVKEWSTQSIRYLIQEFANKQKCAAFKQQFVNVMNNPYYYSTNWPNIVSIISKILREDNISNIDLHRLSQTAIGQQYLQDSIKAHNNYKAMASLVLDELKEIKDV